MSSTACWSSGARTPSASPERRRGWGRCVHPADQCNNAARDDVPLIHDLVCDLATYEKLGDSCISTRDAIREALFASPPSAEVLIGELGQKPVGFALFFHNYSTFLGRKGIFLEDLFVRPESRGSGVGKALLRALAQVAVARDCARIEWSVLDWNTPSIAFYSSLGAAPMAGWSVFRMTDEAISALAASDRHAAVVQA